MSRPDPFCYAQSADALGASDAHVAWLPPVVGREALFDALEKALCLPGYFGRNWDALSDVLRSLEFLEPKRVILGHGSLPHLEPHELHAYLDVLADAIDDWRGDDAHELVACFPTSAVPAVGAWRAGGEQGDGDVEELEGPPAPS